MSEINRGTLDPGQCGGRPRLRGLCMCVRDVLTAGADRTEIQATHCLQVDGDITAAFEYAACGWKRYMVDAQLTPALARWPDAEKYPAARIGDLGMVAASDGVNWDHARGSDVVITTKDEDYERRKMYAADGPPAVWMRLPITRWRHLLGCFAVVVQQLLAALGRGATLVEVT